MAKLTVVSEDQLLALLLVVLADLVPHTPWAPVAAAEPDWHFWLPPLAVVLAASIAASFAKYALGVNTKQHEASLAADKERLDVQLEAEAARHALTLEQETERQRLALEHDRHMRWMDDARVVLAETLTVCNNGERAVYGVLAALQEFGRNAPLAAQEVFVALSTQLDRLRMQRPQLEIRFGLDSDVAQALAKIGKAMAQVEAEAPMIAGLEDEQNRASLVSNVQSERASIIRSLDEFEDAARVVVGATKRTESDGVMQPRQAKSSQTDETG